MCLLFRTLRCQFIWYTKLTVTQSILILIKIKCSKFVKIVLERCSLKFVLILDAVVCGSNESKYAVSIGFYNILPTSFISIRVTNRLTKCLCVCEIKKKGKNLSYEVCL